MLLFHHLCALAGFHFSNMPELSSESPPALPAVHSGGNIETMRDISVHSRAKPPLELHGRLVRGRFKRGETGANLKGIEFSREGKAVAELKPRTICIIQFIAPRVWLSCTYLCSCARSRFCPTFGRESGRNCTQTARCSICWSLARVCSGLLLQCNSLSLSAVLGAWQCGSAQWSRLSSLSSLPTCRCWPFHLASLLAGPEAVHLSPVSEQYVLGKVCTGARVKRC
jgi:hypothetical protein